jgi:hypothetical protein
MDLVTILRTLSRRRGLVILGGALAIVCGLLIAFHVSLMPPKLESRKQEVGTGVARMLVDTPRSVIVELNPRGSEFLGSRANVLANVMVDGQLKESIARRAGIRPKQLFAAAETATAPELTPTAPTDQPYAMVTRVLGADSGEQIPIIEIETEAPQVRTAAALANSAMESVQTYLESKAAEEMVPDARRLFVDPIGPAEASKVTRGAGPLVAFAAAILIFMMVCGAIAFATSLAAGWRRAAAGEVAPMEPAPEPAVDTLPRTPRVQRVPASDADAHLQLLKRDLAS